MFSQRSLLIADMSVFVVQSSQPPQKDGDVFDINDAPDYEKPREVSTEGGEKRGWS